MNSEHGLYGSGFQDLWSNITPLYYLCKVWMALGHSLGWVNIYIILGLVFIVVLQPIAYVMRLTGYDPLKRKRKREKTYREKRQDHRIDLTRIF